MRDGAPRPARMATQRAVREATARVARLRRERPGGDVHRAVRRARIAPRQLAAALALAAGTGLLLLALQPPLLDFWREDFLFWARAGGPVIALGAEGGIGTSSPALPEPQPGEFAAVGIATLAVFGATPFLPDPLTPLKYLLRLLGSIQASALLFFLLAPGRFPYTVAWHLEAVLASGRAVMFVAAVLTPLVEGALGVPAGKRLAHALSILAYFALAVPQQVVLHAWLLQRGSVLLMPLLYLGFGALLHVVLYVALLSWMLSDVEIAATG